ncbi:MAG: SDR family oxidoreductase [Saprospiraceae bacterium]|nr:SDR family oxidoreductase [Saprospiraceae bacterium]
MDINLQGKRALVCGASRGIGRAAAFELASLGAQVTLLARTENTLRDLQAQLPIIENAQHGYLAADFQDHEGLESKVRELLKAGPIHILVNNSGGPAGGPILEAKPEAFLAAFKQHLISGQILAQLLIPGMKEEGFGRIVNVISTSVKQPIGGLGVSNTTRGAVANWAKTLATEVASFGITVNNVLPGSTDTERLAEIFTARARRNNSSIEVEREKMRKIVPAGRFAAPEEIAAAIGFLASPAAAYVNGINFPVDGGRTKSL